ncbi:MAG: hypothetical protein JSV89_22515 [Spirochaetaceae bacterium]|nr:MAG: hypothetical protein JSV89_22515 [Spirochaetaceae bacterium]
MKVWIWFIVALSTAEFGAPPALSSPVDADRPTSVPQQLVIENDTELEGLLARTAFARVSDHFQSMGFPIPSASYPRIAFQDRIMIDGTTIDHACGVFDPSTDTIYMIHYDSLQFQTYSSLGIEACEELYFTILVHELAHYANSQVSPGLIITIDELIAAAVQLSLMDAELRNRILGSTDVKRFQNVREIRIMEYRNDPDNFVLASYFLSIEKPEMFLRFLMQANPPLRDPFFIN